MTIGELLKTVLAGITAYAPMPGREADGAVAPYIVYIAFGPKHYGGAAGLLTAAQPCRVQLDVYGNTYLETEGVRAQIEAAMGAYSGNGGLLGAVTICATQVNSHYIGQDPDVNLHRYMLEFSVWYKP